MTTDPLAHRPPRTGNTTKHRQRRPAVRRHENHAPPDRASWVQARRCSAQTRGHGLLATPRLETLAELAKISEHRQVFAYSRALLCISVNNKAEALRWLEQSFADRDGANVGWIKVDPMLDPLRGDPGFEELVLKVTAPKTGERP